MVCYDQAIVATTNNEPIAVTRSKYLGRERYTRLVPESPATIFDIDALAVCDDVRSVAENHQAFIVGCSGKDHGA